MANSIIPDLTFPVPLWGQQLITYINEVLDQSYSRVIGTTLYSDSNVVFTYINPTTPPYDPSILIQIPISTLDGVTLLPDQLILFGNQTNPIENGVYIVRSIVPTQIQRLQTFKYDTQIENSACLINEGSNYKGKVFSFDITLPFTINVDPITVSLDGTVNVTTDKWGNILENNVIKYLTTTTTATGTTTLTIASTGVQVFTGTQNQTLVLPNATTLTNGWPFYIINQSTGIITIQDNGNNTLLALPSGKDINFILKDNSTANGSWIQENKQTLVVSPVNGDILTTDASGQAVDSGFSINNINPFSSPLNTEIADALSTYNFITTVASAGKNLEPVMLYFDTNQVLSGLPTQGAYTCVDGDRVVCAGQTNPAENLIYVVHSGAWTVADDSLTVNDLLSAWITIYKGTYATEWTYTFNIVPVSGDVTPTSVSWSVPLNQTLYTAGNGININQGIISLTQAPANTYKGNATGSLANVTDIATNTAFNQNFETTASILTKPSRTPSVGTSDNIIRADAIFPIDSKKQNRIISVASETAMLALVDDEPNNILIDANNTRAYRSDEQTTYLLVGTPASSIANWQRESGYPIWVSTTVYATSNIFVKYNDKLYRSKQAVPINQDPALDTTEVYWELIGSSTVLDLRTVASRTASLVSGVIASPKSGTDSFKSKAGAFYTRTTRSETSINYTIQDPLSFTFYTRNGAVTGTLPTGLQTNFVSLYYDNAGVITDMGANGNATFGIMYADPSTSNSFAFLIGQTLYTGGSAVADAGRDATYNDLVVPTALQTWREIGRLVYRRDLVTASNFDDTSRFTWLTSSSNASGVSSSSTPIANTISQWDANVNFSANNFLSNITTTTTTGGTTTLIVSSSRIQVFTGTLTQIVVLPNATTLANGTQYNIINQSTGTVTVNMNGGTLLTTIPANGFGGIFTVTNIGTSAGTWDFNLEANTTTIQQATISPTKAIPANNDTIDTINNKLLGLINTRSSAAPLAIANLATGGAIGTAVATVDVNNVFLVNQTTTGQTLTLPNPTASTLGQVVSVIANSTAGFTMYGIAILAGKGQQYVWTGSSWVPNSTVYTGPVYFTASSQATMTALSTAAVGDICVRTDTTPLGLFRLTALPASTASNWKSNITGTLYGQVTYGLAASVTGVTTNTTLNFSSLRNSIGLTNFVSSNPSGLLTLSSLTNGLSFEFEGMTVHYSSATNGGIACRWRKNATQVGTYGGSAVSTATDQNIGASALATYSDTISTVSTTAQYDLVLTGWTNLNVYQGNSNIPSSYIKITARNL